MATELATAYVSLVPSMRGVKSTVAKELGDAGEEGAARTERAFSKHAGKVGASFKTALKGAAVLGGAAFGAAALGAKAALDSANDYQESVSKIDAVFGGAQAKKIEDWAASAAVGFGQSKAQAVQAAGDYGNLLTSFGLTADASADMSMNMVQLASDLASFNNTSPEDALAALRSGLTGETEPLKRFGIALDDASLKAKALEMGIADGKSVLTPAQKAQASYALILERSANAQGDFARTSTGAANQQRIFAARIEDLKLKVGQALLPALNKLLPVIGSLIDKAGPLIDKAIPMMRQEFESISAWWQANGPAISATATKVFGAVTTAFQAWVGFVRQNWPTVSAIITKGAQTVKTVIGGLVSVVTTLWDNFGNNILELVRRIWPNIRQIIEGVMNVIQGIIKTVTSLIKGDWANVWEGLKQVVHGAWNAILGIIKGAAELVRSAVGVVAEVIGSVLKSAWNGVSTWFSDRFDEFVGFWQALPGRISAHFVGMFNGIKDAFKSAVNWVIRQWNNLSFTIGGGEIMGKQLPSVTLDTPNIPEFHAGGVVPGRPGQEVLALLQAGETVRTREQEAGLGAGITFGDININGGKGGVGAATDIVRSMKTAMWLGGVA